MKTLALISALALSAAAVKADDTADIELFTDYMCGVWQISGNALFDDSNAERPHSYQRSVKISMPAGSEFEFDHTYGGQDLTNVGYLEFWAYTTSTALGDVTVQARVLGEPRPGIALNSLRIVKRNEWQRFQIPLSSLSLSQGEKIQIIWFKAPTNFAIPSFWIDDVKFVKNPVSRTSVVVDAQNTVRTLDRKMFGVGTFTWDWSLTMPATKAKMQEAGITFLNFPGGNTADDYDWLNNRAVSTGLQAFVSTDQYLQLANDINADKMLTANYGSGTPQMAADWLTYCNIAHGANVIYWSIGNECMQQREPDIRPHPYDHDAWTYAQFVHDCIVLMRAIDPRVKIGISGSIGPWDFPQRVSVVNPRTGQMENGWGPVMLSRLRDLGTLPDYYDYHLYPASPGKESDNTTLQAASVIQFLTDITRTMLQDYLGPAGTSLPINLTETNSTFIPVGKQTTSLTNALFLTDYWGYNCKAGLGAFVWWNLHNGATVQDGNFHESLYGWRSYATLGILSEGLPEGLAEPLNTPYPTFYAYKLLKQFARPGDTLVQASSNNELLSVYASRAASTGRLRLLVINKAKNSDITAEFWISHYTVPLLGTAHKYGMTEDISMSDISNSAVTLIRPILGSGQSKTSITFERYSITVVEM